MFLSDSFLRMETLKHGHVGLAVRVWAGNRGRITEKVAGAAGLEPGGQDLHNSLKR
jgi:hypothetical protein